MFLYKCLEYSTENVRKNGYPGMGCDNLVGSYKLYCTMKWMLFLRMSLYLSVQANFISQKEFLRQVGEVFSEVISQFWLWLVW